MKPYYDLLRHVLEHGEPSEDRTGTGTLSAFGVSSRYKIDLNAFPVLTGKKLHLKSVVAELLWFLRGDTNVKWLQEQGVSIWNEWADASGDLGPIYGKQWRNYDGVDQINGVIESLKANPRSRRHIVSAWNVRELPAMALPPCHLLFQFYVSADRRLSCQLYQRSADLFLGVPFNVTSYALLTAMVAQVCGYGLGDFVHVIGDAHIYNDHLTQVSVLLDRESGAPPLPKLRLAPHVTIDAFEMGDIRFEDYNPLPAIPARVAV